MTRAKAARAPSGGARKASSGRGTRARTAKRRMKKLKEPFWRLHRDVHGDVSFGTGTCDCGCGSIDDVVIFINKGYACTAREAALFVLLKKDHLTP